MTRPFLRSPLRSAKSALGGNSPVDSAWITMGVRALVQLVRLAQALLQDIFYGDFFG